MTKKNVKPYVSKRLKWVVVKMDLQEHFILFT